MPDDAPLLPSPTIEAAFGLHGDLLPLDHGYPLYAALSGLPGVGPWLHASTAAAVHPVLGRYAGPGLLRLTPASRLTLRLPAAALPRVLAVSGRALRVAGHPVRIGVPRTALLRGARTLRARLVTTRNGEDAGRFDAEVRRQLDALGIGGRVRRGPRRVLRLRGRLVVGHALLVADLTGAESIRLQESGLGGRRKMGCGVFLPCGDAAGDPWAG